MGMAPDEVTVRPGGRSSTPCMAGRVRVAAVTPASVGVEAAVGAGFSATFAWGEGVETMTGGLPCAWGMAATGTGLIEGGSAAGGDLASSDADLPAGDSGSGSVGFFPALKKM